MTWREKVMTQMESLRADGKPLTFDELLGWPETPVYDANFETAKSALELFSKIEKRSKWKPDKREAQLIQRALERHPGSEQIIAQWEQEMVEWDDAHGKVLMKSIANKEHYSLEDMPPVPEFPFPDVETELQGEIDWEKEREEMLAEINRDREKFEREDKEWKRYKREHKAWEKLEKKKPGHAPRPEFPEFEDVREREPETIFVKEKVELEEEITPEAWARAEAHLSTFAQVLARIQAVEGPVDRRVMLAAEAYFEQQSELMPKIVGMSRLLLLAAVRDALKGEGRTWLHDIVRAAHLARSLLTIRLMIDHLAYLACVGQILHAVKYIVMRRELSDEELGEITQTLQPLYDEGALALTFAGERVFLLEGFRQEMQLSEADGAWWEQLRVSDARQLSRFLTQLEEHEAAACLPLQERYSAFLDLRKKYQKSEISSWGIGVADLRLLTEHSLFQLALQSLWDLRSGGDGLVRREERPLDPLGGGPLQLEVVSGEGDAQWIIHVSSSAVGDVDIMQRLGVGNNFWKYLEFHMPVHAGRGGGV